MPRIGARPREESPYDVTKAAPGYANVTGLVSTFALAAVVLVFLIAATAAKSPTTPQNVDMGFATILFALGFLGCLLAAFAFASLGGAPNSAAILTNSMLVSSAVAVCLLAVLGGFEALARAFLPQAAAAFAVICAVTACLSPVFVWFPQFDIAREFPLGEGTPGGRQADAVAIGGTQVTNEERDVLKLLIGMTAVGLIASFAALGVHITHAFGRPRSWEYYLLGFWGLTYTGLVIVGALILAIDPDRRLTAGYARTINLIQCGFMFSLIAVLP